MIVEGSAEKPVRLDPFQNIVNVHWNTIKYIAIEVAIFRQATDDFPLFPPATPRAYFFNWGTSEADPDLPLNPNDFSDFSTIYLDHYVTGLKYDWTTPGRVDVWRKDKGWSSESVTISDLTGPSNLPHSATFGPWEWAGFNAGAGLDALNPGNHPILQMAASSGGTWSDPDGEHIAPPFPAGLPPYVESSSAEIHLFGLAFSGSPGTYRNSVTDYIQSTFLNGAGQVIAVIGHYTDGGNVAATAAVESAFSSYTVDISSLGFRAFNKTWAPIAMSNDTDGVISVLLAPVSVTT